MIKKKIYPTKLYMRILTRIVFYCYVRFHSIKKIMPADVKNLKAPYLLLSNHVGFWDPFVVGYFLKPFTQFVSSDAAFRNPFMRFFLKRLGTLPKKKNVRDTKVIRDMIALIKQGNCLGLFPEGLRTWAGESLPMDISIAKLIKMLNVPVVAAVIKGMNLFHPRWSRKIRPTRMEVEYKILFTIEQIKQLSESELFDQLKNGIYHNEIAYQRLKLSRIHSKHKAEHINHALYICPDCHTIDSFRAHGNEFHCIKCNYDIHINEFGFFKRKSRGILFFDNILDWYSWEEKWLLNYINFKFESHFNQLIFEDKDSMVYHNESSVDFKMIGKADIKLYIDRIEINFNNGSENLIMNFNDLQTINPQVNERLEIFYKSEAYRIVGSRKGVSALKWEVALNAIWNKLGQKHKLSAYIKQES